MSIDRGRASREVRAGRAVVLAAFVALIALACAGCGSSTSLTAAVFSPPGISITNPLTTVPSTVTTTVTGPTLTTAPSARSTIQVGGEDASVAPTSTKQGFLGIASELSTITGLSGPAKDPDTPFIHLLADLSPGAPFLLRLGGDSADWAWWKVPGLKTPEAVRYTVTPQWGADVKALLTALDAKALLGVNLELNSKRIAAYEVKQYAKYVGSNLIDGYELGNEPELYTVFNFYTRPDGVGVLGRVLGHYTMDDYAKDFTNIASALGNVPLVGPGSGSPTWLPDLSKMLSELPARLKLVTVHAYPLKNCSPASHVTIPDFFTTASIQGQGDLIQPMVTAAAAHGKALRVDELNGVTCGGTAGVSNSFGEALWALNLLPTLWKAGVQGVNFQTIASNNNNMISARHSASGWHVTVEPEYYGLLTFADVAPAGSHLLRISAPAPTGFYQYAVRAPDGGERIVMTNVSGQARNVGVRAVGVHGTGEVARLTAPSLASTSGATLAGQQLDSSTGELSGSTSYTLVKPNRRGVYAVRVPAGSAAILTVSS